MFILLAKTVFNFSLITPQFCKDKERLLPKQPQKRLKNEWLYFFTGEGYQMLSWISTKAFKMTDFARNGQ